MSMINYIRNLKRLLQMENKEHNINLEELVLAINDKINHIEDAMIDHRELLIKLVKQNNEVVKVLKGIEIEEVSDDEDITDMMKNDMPKPEGKFIYPLIHSTPKGGTRIFIPFSNKAGLYDEAAV